MGISPERVAEVVKIFVPLILGITSIIVGFTQGSLAYVTVGGGLLGIPGLGALSGASTIKGDLHGTLGESTFPHERPTV